MVRIKHDLPVSRSLTGFTESVIDGVPHPELRDRMILLRGNYKVLSPRKLRLMRSL